MVKRPGGQPATRPLHFIWLVDTSGSMSVHGKIQALNTAIRETLPPMWETAAQNPNASVLVRCVRFSHGADWHVERPTPLDEFTWTDLAADPLQRAGADVVFLMDTTSSMGPYLDGLRWTCIQFADQVAEAGVDVRLGLLGFGDLPIGEPFRPHALTDDALAFQKAVATLPCEGGGDTPESSLDAVREGLGFEFRPDAQRVLVLITDAPPHEPDMSGQSAAQVTALAAEAGALVYVIGPDLPCWRELAARTGGEWYAIADKQRFLEVIGSLGGTVAGEVSRRLASGVVSAGTDAGAAVRLVAEQLRMPPMEERALPPVLVLVSDGQATDDCEAAVDELLHLPWGKRAVRLAIGIGGDADTAMLQRFIAHPEYPVLQANNMEALTRYIRWASTVALKAASAPPSVPHVAGAPAAGAAVANVPLPPIPEPDEGTDLAKAW